MEKVRLRHGDSDVDGEDKITVYEGVHTGRVRRVKFLSLTSSAIFLSMAPSIATKIMNSDATAFGKFLDQFKSMNACSEFRDSAMANSVYSRGNGYVSVASSHAAFSFRRRCKRLIFRVHHEHTVNPPIFDEGVRGRDEVPAKHENL